MVHVPRDTIEAGLLDPDNVAALPHGKVSDALVQFDVDHASVFTPPLELSVKLLMVQVATLLHPPEPAVYPLLHPVSL